MNPADIATSEHATSALLPPAAALGPTKFRCVIVVLAAAIFAGAASMRVLDALLPTIAKTYGATIGGAGLTVTAYAVSYSLCQLFYGPLGDRVGPFRVIGWTAGASAVAALGCALAPSLGWLVGLRFVAGGIAAAIGPLALAWISHATTVEDRPFAVANVTVASIVGATAGQLGGGLIGELAGWEAAFMLIALLFGGAGVALGLTGIYSPGLRAIGRSPRREGVRNPGFGMLLRRLAVRKVLVAVGVEGFAMYLSFIYVAAVLQDRYAISLAEVGLLVALFGLGGVFFALVARILVRLLPESRRAALGSGLCAGGLLLLTLPLGVLAAIVALLVLGFGFFMLHNILQVRATRMAVDAPGVGMSLFAGSFFLAQALGATAGGWLLDRFGASVPFSLSALMLAALGMVLNHMRDDTLANADCAVDGEPRSR